MSEKIQISQFISLNEEEIITYFNKYSLQDLIDFYTKNVHVNSSAIYDSNIIFSFLNINDDSKELGLTIDQIFFTITDFFNPLLKLYLNIKISNNINCSISFYLHYDEKSVITRCHIDCIFNGILTSYNFHNFAFSATFLTITNSNEISLLDKIIFAQKNISSFNEKCDLINASLDDGSFFKLLFKFYGKKKHQISLARFKKNNKFNINRGSEIHLIITHMLYFMNIYDSNLEEAMFLSAWVLNCCGENTQEWIALKRDIKFLPNLYRLPIKLDRNSDEYKNAYYLILKKANMIYKASLFKDEIKQRFDKISKNLAQMMNMQNTPYIISLRKNPKYTL